MKAEAADRKASDREARLLLHQHSIDRSIEEQRLTDDDLRECIDLGDEFHWVAPLSRSAAIEHLNRLQHDHRGPEHSEVEHVPHPLLDELQADATQHEPAPHLEPERFELADPTEHFDYASEPSHFSDSSASVSDDERWRGGLDSRPG